MSNYNTDKEGTKACSKCKKELPATNEFFGRYKRSKDGLRWECKKCRMGETEKNKERKKEYDKRYREENGNTLRDKHKDYYHRTIDQRRAYSKKYREENAEIISAAKSEYYFENKVKISAKQRIYYRNNKEYLLEKQQRYYMANYENVREYRKKWGLENRDRINRLGKVYKQRRRARAATLDADYSSEEWEMCKRSFGYRCAYCGGKKKLEQDHFIALAKGGEYTKNNIVPACRSCNSSKNATDFFVWYPNYKYYSLEREMELLKHLKYTKERNQQLTLV